MHKEDLLGSIEVGKLADLVVLDRDYMTIPVDEIRDLLEREEGDSDGEQDVVNLPSRSGEIGRRAHQEQQRPG